MNVTPEEIPAVARLVNDVCGVILDESKAYLINSRLGKIVDAAGCVNYADFCQQARQSLTLRSLIADAITTQETLFFRDHSPFEALQHKVLPDTIDSKVGTLAARKIRIWSAACSTGQEPYSIVMTLCELIPDIHEWDVQIWPLTFQNLLSCTPPSGDTTNSKQDAASLRKCGPSTLRRHRAVGESLRQFVT
jgi:chemotaxis protein methyltransferase CheR